VNKKLLLVMATTGGAAGSYAPILFGDNSFFDGWQIIGGLIGGLFGIWVGVKLSKRFS
jgi:uncharacterized membrane protein YfcA